MIRYDGMSPSGIELLSDRSNRMRRSDQLQQTLSARSFLSESTASNSSNNESRRGRPRIAASPSASAGGATASGVQVIHGKSNLNRAIADIRPGPSHANPSRPAYISSEKRDGHPESPNPSRRAGKHPPHRVISLGRFARWCGER